MRMGQGWGDDGDGDGDGMRMGQQWGWGEEKETERNGHKDGSETEDGVGDGDRAWDKDRDGKGTETGVELSPSHTSCSTKEKKPLPTSSLPIPNTSQSYGIPALEPPLGLLPLLLHCYIVSMSREPVQGPAPSHLPSPAAAPTSRHIPFVFPFPGGPLIELSRSISVAAAAVIRRRCGRAGTRLGPRSCIPPAPAPGAAIPNLPREIRSADSH